MFSRTCGRIIPSEVMIHPTLGVRVVKYGQLGLLI